MSLWLDRVTALVEAAPSRLVLIGGADWGLEYVLEVLGRKQKLAWLAGTPSQQDDPVAQGNLLADALNRASGSRIFAHGLSAAYQLETLERYAADIGPLMVAVTDSAPVAQLVALLLERELPGLRVIADLPAAPDLQLPGAELHPGAILEMLPEEALNQAPPDLDPDAVLAALQAADGRMPAFMTWLHGQLGLPPPTRPGPAGELLAAEDSRPVSPDALVSGLIRARRHTEALEVAVRSQPARVEEVLRNAGPDFQQKGLLPRLHVLLSALDEPWSLRERTLEWRLVSGISANDYRHLLPLIDGHLARNPAPALRARRAALMSPERGFEEARRALAFERTPLTLWQAGRMSSEFDSAITLLHESVRLAEDSGSGYEIVRNMGSLAQVYFHAGRYHDAMHWSRLALDELDRAEINDGRRRARIMNVLTYTSVLLGHLLGVRHLLDENLERLRGDHSDLMAATRHISAALELALGNPDAALETLDSGREYMSRRARARLAYSSVRVLLNTGDDHLALDIASEARSLGTGEDPLLSNMADLAKGMVLAVAGDQQAGTLLDPLITSANLSIEDRLTAYLYLRLLPGTRQKPPDDLAGPLAELAPSGLRALSGPENVFAPVWQSLLGTPGELQITALGNDPVVRLHDTEIRLTKRLWEVLLVLALNPGGLTDEQLLYRLVGDSDAYGLNALRTHVSRLRALIPVSDKPYRLEVTYSLDLQTLREALGRGDVRQALQLASGPLLPASSSPGVEELRQSVAEELRQAVLLAGDPEAAFELADRRRDDLELWEYAAGLLPATDGRRAIARASVERLRAEYGF